MAVRELQTLTRMSAPVLPLGTATIAVMGTTYTLASLTNGAPATYAMYAGQVVMLTDAGHMVLAVRGALAADSWRPLDGSQQPGVVATFTALAEFPKSRILGVLAEDKARSAVTMIQPDPVGATVLNAAGTTFSAYNNAFYTASKRALGDWMDETIGGVTDLTSDGGYGWTAGRRNLDAYTGAGTQLIVDSKAMASVVTTNYAVAANDDAANSLADVTTAAVWSSGVLLTVGTGINCGRFVVLEGVVYATKLTGSGSIASLYSNYYAMQPLARLDYFDSAAGLFYITLM